MSNLSLQELKSSLIEDLKSRVADKILEQSNFLLLEKLINNAEDKTEAIAIAELGTSYKRTGFHFDKRLEKIGSTIKYFKKNTNLSFTQSNSDRTHKLIIGDNYDALLNLSISYKKKIDVIYIDPPYGKDDMGDFADTNYNNAITRDNLLSMLYPRLVLARQLLSDEGVIFCSIDDKNQAYVKGLMDEVFGENNFICCAPRKTGAGNAAANSDNKLRKPYDFIICYSSHSTHCKFTKLENGVKMYPFSDEKGNYDLKPLQATGSSATREERPNLYYPIYVQNDNTLSLEKNLFTIKEILPSQVKGHDGRWMWSKQKFVDCSQEFLVYDNSTIKRKVYFDETEDQTKYSIDKAYFDEGKYSNKNGTTLLEKIIGQDKFNNPKPVELIKKLISLKDDSNNSIILDFFAGSGTTGQAVLELNKEDGGNRTFILCTNNEVTDKNQNGIAYDVTSKRLKRVMTGSCYDGSNGFEWIKKNDPLGGNLDVYEIANVSNIEQEKGKSAFDVIDEELYGEVKLTPQDKIKWVCENFSVTQKYLEE